MKLLGRNDTSVVFHVKNSADFRHGVGSEVETKPNVYCTVLTLERLRIYSMYVLQDATEVSFADKILLNCSFP